MSNVCIGRYSYLNVPTSSKCQYCIVRGFHRVGNIRDLNPIYSVIVQTYLRMPQHG